jgi:hypothetical protein
MKFSTKKGQKIEILIFSIFLKSGDFTGFAMRK